jgi:hypothetical protein
MLLPGTDTGEVLTPVDVQEAPSPDLLAKLRNKTITPAQLVDLGGQLAGCVLPVPIRELFLGSFRRLGVDEGLRLRLMIADPALRTWPWEFAYVDPLGGPASTRGFLALDPRVSIVRHEPMPWPHVAIESTRKDLHELRLILAAAAPKDLGKLDIKRELEGISAALKNRLVDGVRLTCEAVLEHATWDALVAATARSNSADIFHFTGHGKVFKVPDPFGPGTAATGYLFREDKLTDTGRLISADHLAPMLRRAGVRLAVLMACETGRDTEEHPWHSVAGALVANGIAAVIAMQHEVKDVHAIEFSRAFYAGLASGLSLDEAVSIGRLAMLSTTGQRGDLPANVEWGVPALHSRLVDGHLFPERVQRAGEAARRIRTIVRQTVDTIETGGTVVGVRVADETGAIRIVQEVRSVMGRLEGATNSAADVTQKADRVHSGAKVTGVVRRR